MLKGNLRPISIMDAEMILSWRNQDFVRLNMYHQDVIDIESHMKWFHSMLEDNNSEYFIYERDSEPLGLVSFTNIDKRNRKAFWAFYAADEHRMGVGVEMETLALNYAFESLKLHKLCCEVLEFNLSVINLHKRFGFVQEGVRRKDYFRDGQYFDIYQLALFQDTYTSSRFSNAIKLKRRHYWDVVISSVDLQLMPDYLVSNIFLELQKYIECDYQIQHCTFDTSKTYTNSLGFTVLEGAFLLKTHINGLTVIYVDIRIKDEILLSGEISVFIK